MRRRDLGPPDPEPLIDDDDDTAADAADGYAEDAQGAIDRALQLARGDGGNPPTNAIVEGLVAIAKSALALTAELRATREVVEQLVEVDAEGLDD